MSIKYFISRTRGEEAYVAESEPGALEYVENFIEDGTLIEDVEIYKVNTDSAMKVQMTLAPVAKIKKA